MRDEWADILDADEVILWQGRPDRRISVPLSGIPQILVGCLFAAMALHWISNGLTGKGAFWVIPLLFLSIGLWTALYPIFGEAQLRRHTFYSLGKSLKTWPIEPATAPEFEPGSPGSIFFAEEPRRSRNGPYMRRIGFERIEDANHVFRMMREMQSGGITARTAGE